MKEADFKASFRKRLKRELKAIAVLQYKQDATTVSGFPDTICLGPESVVFFIEFKQSPRAHFRPGQKEWGEKLTARNFFYYCVNPINADQVIAEMKEICR